MNTEHEPKLPESHTDTDSKALTVKESRKVVGRPFEPGNQLAKGRRNKQLQMTVFRQRLEEINPGDDKPRLLALFDDAFAIANNTVTWHDGQDRIPKYQSGKDRIAAMTFLIEESYGPLNPDLDGFGGNVTVIQIAIPQDGRLAVGVDTRKPESQMVKAEFDDE